MKSRSFIAVAASIVLLLACAGAVLAYDSAQRHTIARGITVGGVDIGGLSDAQARARLAAAYRQRLGHPLVLHFGRQRFVLSPRRARVTVSVQQSVQQALDRTRSDNIFVRVFRSVTDGEIHASIDPQISYSSAALDRMVAHVARVLNRSAHDASISFAGDSIGQVTSTTGIAVRSARLTAMITSALTDPARSRSIAIPVTRTRPAVTSAALAAKYPTIITVDRSTFRLRLWKGLRLVRSYTIAVGMAGLETPAGLYHIQDKEVNPSWHVPNSAWAGSLAGQVIAPGPADPIKARWMGIYNGAGIHGTDELSSLGSAASHGCIRMAIPDVIQLYDQTPVGTPVYIA
ncbi:MAG TPA: L,D-transpeptidase family protein [Solirubrobacteraceae bacterium]|nr:L,D-transpeptidase family protein [Solirubrobacteraceae bacterium]